MTAGETRARLAFSCAALLAIVLGLAVHWYGSMLSPPLRDFLGDAVWAVMITCWTGVAAPGYATIYRATIALVICWAVEFTQLYHAPLFDQWRSTSLGGLVFGTGFDLRDLGAYATGVLTALLFELGVRRFLHRRQ